MAEPRSRSWPRRVWILHSTGSSFTAAERAFQGLPAHCPVFRLEPFFDIKQPLAPAQPIPFTDKAEQCCPHCHQPERGFSAVLIPIDLLADDLLCLEHFRSQEADFPTHFIQFVVHGCLLSWHGHHKNKR